MTAHLAREPRPRRDIAVALDGDGKPAGEATRVRASGYGAVARQIVEIAREHGIEIREDADLAEVLAVIEVDSLVPPEVMAAVSEILAYIYRANRDELAGSR